MGYTKAKRFLELLEGGRFKRPVLANHGVHLVEKEKNAVSSYRYFANSFAFDHVMQVSCRTYQGDEQI